MWKPFRGSWHVTSLVICTNHQYSLLRLHIYLILRNTTISLHIDWTLIALLDNHSVFRSCLNWHALRWHPLGLHLHRAIVSLGQLGLMNLAIVFSVRLRTKKGVAFFTKFVICWVDGIIDWFQALYAKSWTIKTTKGSFLLDCFFRQQSCPNWSPALEWVWIDRLRFLSGNLKVKLSLFYSDISHERLAILLLVRFNF